jgi:hypothetical protein
VVCPKAWALQSHTGQSAAASRSLGKIIIFAHNRELPGKAIRLKGMGYMPAYEDIGRKAGKL